MALGESFPEVGLTLRSSGLRKVNLAGIMRFKLRGKSIYGNISYPPNFYNDREALDAEGG